MPEMMKSHAGNRFVSCPGALAEPPVVRWLLITAALIFLGIFLLLPLGMVFASALQKGLNSYFNAFRDEDALSAVRLTLLTAGIAVPLNIIFGLAAS